MGSKCAWRNMLERVVLRSQVRQNRHTYSKKRYVCTQRDLYEKSGCERWVHSTRGMTFWRGSSCVYRCDNRDIYIRKRDVYIRKETCKKDRDVAMSDGLNMSIARGGGLGSSTIFKKNNEPYAPS